MINKIRRILSGTSLTEREFDKCTKELCDLFNVRLSFFQPENCPEWIEGKGDCKKPECTFCKIEAEIEGNEA